MKPRPAPFCKFCPVLSENPYLESPKLEDLIGAASILATLPELLSYRHEGGLLPVELANGVASLSTYPSARILKMFAEENFKTPTVGGL
jgi:hypothetical protein